ncbi:MAG: hypothetical protein ACYSUC_09475 [Planctomycetota bacterium]|jgi:hypothetical protein
MKIDTNQIPDFLDKSSYKPVDSAKALSSSDADASLLINYASLIDKAAEISEVDAEAVQRAQELLQSDEIDSPDNIRKAAEDIVGFGI